MSDITAQEMTAAEKDQQYENDLHPHNRAGQSDQPDAMPGRTAYDVKDIHDRLNQLPNHELKQIAILDTGTRLQEGAVYLDLRRLDEGGFRGMNNREVAADDAIAAKSELDYEQWNYLTGDTTVAQTGRFSRLVNAQA